MEIRMRTRLLIPAIALALLTGLPAAAQDKAKGAKAEKGKMTTVVLLDNDKVRVTENHYKPGDEGPMAARSFRVVRALKGGTLQRTYADGKVDKSEWKTGEVRAQGPDPAYIPKNIGKSDFVVYSVQFKQSK